MSMHTLRVSLIASVLSAGAMPALAQVTTYDFHLGTQYFGRLKQTDLPNIGNYACGPSSAVNSMVYLQNRYGSLYGSTLVPAQSSDLNNDGQVTSYDNLMSAAQILASSAYANTGSMGTAPGFMASGLQNYIEGRAPGRSAYALQCYYAWDSSLNPQPPYGDVTIPTWNFMYDHLRQGAAVELMFTWVTNGHYVSLAGMHWADTNANGRIDSGESTLELVDPWTATILTPNLYQDPATGELHVDTLIGHSNPLLGAILVTTPVPEPAATSLLLLAATATLRRRR